VDFDYSEEQEAARQLADRIFTDRSTHERLKEVESAAGEQGPFDDRLWSALADAGLLGIGLPDDVGGAGLDFVATCLVVEAAGRTAAYVPIVETLVMGAGTIDQFGTEAQRRRWLPKVVGGEVVLTAALAEQVGDVVQTTFDQPATTATPEGDGWRLVGTKACVPAGLRADLLLVPATVRGADAAGGGGSVGLFLLDPSAPGVRRTRQDGPALPEALVELDGVMVGAADRLGGPDGDGRVALEWMAQRATAALCIAESAVAAAALALTAEYTKTRQQFGKAIATFQAVGQRAADAYVDTEAIRLTAWQAVWRLSRGLPAAAEVAVAKFWAADGGQRVVHAATHLHGGVGVDRDYPLHRFFLRTRQIELTLGGAHDSLARLGRMLADEPV
jgi:alkylation response protein AidB-like acyl-CoA dehydrogenase